MRRFIMLMAMVVCCYPLTAFAAQHKVAATKGGLFCLLGNPLSQNLKFVYDDQRQSLLVIDSTGSAYPLVVRSAAASKPDSTTVNPAMPDWNDAAANAARDNLDRQVQLVCDSLLDAKVANVMVAETMAVMYKHSAIVDSVWFDSSQVCVRWRGWTMAEPKLVSRSHPLPSQQEQMASWLAPIVAHINRGGVVIMGLDGLPTYYGAGFAPVIRQEIADLRAGQTLKTNLIQSANLKQLMVQPMPLARIKVTEER